jgi:hypothetical protein
MRRPVLLNIQPIIIVRTLITVRRRFLLLIDAKHDDVLPQLVAVREGVSPHGTRGSSRFFSTLDTTPRRSRARPTARTSARSRFFPSRVTSPPTAGAFMCDSIWARHRAKAFAPSAEYTKSEPHTKSHWRSRSPSTLNPSTSFQSNALAFSPADEVPSSDVLWPRDRLRRRRSNAPPSVVSVAVHD